MMMMIAEEDEDGNDEAATMMKAMMMIMITKYVDMILASPADAVLARHAIFPPRREERLRDEPKQRLRGRLIRFLP